MAVLSQTSHRGVLNSGVAQQRKPLRAYPGQQQVATTVTMQQQQQQPQQQQQFTIQAHHVLQQQRQQSSNSSSRYVRRPVVAAATTLRYSTSTPSPNQRSPSPSPSRQFRCGSVESNGSIISEDSVSPTLGRSLKDDSAFLYPRDTNATPMGSTPSPRCPSSSSSFATHFVPVHPACQSPSNQPTVSVVAPSNRRASFLDDQENYHPMQQAMDLSRPNSRRQEVTTPPQQQQLDVNHNLVAPQRPHPSNDSAMWRPW